MQTRKANDVSALTAKSDTTIAHISLISNYGAFVLLFTCLDNKVSFFQTGVARLHLLEHHYLFSKSSRFTCRATG